MPGTLSPGTDPSRMARRTGRHAGRRQAENLALKRAGNARTYAPVTLTCGSPVTVASSSPISAAMRMASSMRVSTI